MTNMKSKLKVKLQKLADDTGTPHASSEVLLLRDVLRIIESECEEAYVMGYRDKALGSGLTYDSISEEFARVGYQELLKGIGKAQA